MKVYKLDPSQVSSFTKSANYRLLVLILISQILFTVSFYSFISSAGDVPGDILMIYVGGFVFAYGGVTIFYFLSKKFNRRRAEKLVIKIDDQAIIRSVDPVTEERMNRIRLKSGLDNISDPAIYSRIEFKGLKSLKKKRGDLWLYSSGYSVIRRRGFLVVPRELEGFKEVEDLVLGILNSKKR